MAIGHSEEFFKQASKIALSLDFKAVEQLVKELVRLRERRGRLFLLGVGGSAANCSHAVNDFRKLAGIEAYTPVDNVAELTARTNDDGWATVFKEWLKTSCASPKDAVLVFSVGGGDAERNISPNIVHALDEAKQRGVKVYGIVGPNGGHTSKVGDLVIRVPVENLSSVTPHTEAFQAVIWHCIVCHPDLMQVPNKWENITNAGEKNKPKKARGISR